MHDLITGLTQSVESGFKQVQQSLDVLDLPGDSVGGGHVLIKLLPLGHQLIHRPDKISLTIFTNNLRT